MNDHISNPSITETDTTFEPETNSSSPDAGYFCITKDCPEAGQGSLPIELANLVEGKPTCTECGKPLVSSVDDIEITATEPKSDEAKRAAEVEALLAGTGIKREDIENWGQETAAAESEPVVNEPEPPSPKLAELVDPIPVSNGLPEYPVELVAKAIKNNLTRQEVEQFVGDVKMSLSLGAIKEKAFSIVVTDSTQQDLMKQARELRLQLKHERLRIDSNAAMLKEPHLRRIQIIDPLRKHIGDMFRECEAHLKLQEDFARLEEDRKREVTRQLRWTELAELGMENLSDLDLGNLTDEAYQTIRATAQAAFDARKEAEEREAAERRRREEKAQIKNARVERLSQLGLTFNGMDYGFENIAFPTLILDDGTDEQFEGAFTEISEKVDKAKQIKAKEQARAQRILDRKSQLVALGLVCDGTGCKLGDITVEFGQISELPETEWSEYLANVSGRVEILNRTKQRVEHVTRLGLTLVGDRYIHAESSATITFAEIEQLDSESFKPVYLVAKTAIDEYRAELARKAEEAEAVLEQQRSAEAAAELRRMAPDKDKLLALAVDLENYQLPEVGSEIGQKAVGYASSQFSEIARTLRGYAAMIESKTEGAA